MTIKKHLSKLPLQKRLQAMENIRKQSKFPLFEIINDEYTESCHALRFVYDETRQGHSYWWEIRMKYFGL